MYQSWRDLLFAHWPLPHGEVRPHVPPALELETFEGSAWIGLTPFRVEGLRPRYLPPIPGLSSFPELNLRTYVRIGDRPGVWFFSLDAASTPAVLAARASYRLPYRRARMSVEERDGWIRYAMRRRGGDAEFVARYRPAGPAGTAESGTLAHFLVERYALYAAPREGRLLRADIHHPPWPLRPARAEIERESVSAAAGLRLPDRPPVLHFSGRQDTVVWRPRRVDPA